ncbi:MAG TPA: hypothetical protein VFP10_02615 [Candidatus Eisenbacteria bacterium]|nr:hypothetical protein [Candidatus Eisenbacteria bacterium]
MATTEGLDTLLCLLGASEAHRAAVFGKPEDVTEIFRVGGELDGKNSVGMTPLELAIVVGNESVGARLCSLGALRPEQVDRAAAWSVLLGRLDVLKAMVANRPGVISSRWDGRSLLGLAVDSRFGWPDSLRDDPRRRVAAHSPWDDRVSPERYQACVDTLLAMGIDADAVGRHGRTPLHDLVYAGVGGRTELAREATLRAQIAKRLLDAGADPNARSFLGETPLHGVVLRGPEIAGSMIELLVPRGAEIDAPDAFGKTPLQHLFSFYEDSVRARIDWNTVGSMHLPSDARARVLERRPSKETIEVGAILAAHGARLDIPETYRDAVESRMKRLRASNQKP